MSWLMGVIVWLAWCWPAQAALLGAGLGIGYQVRKRRDQDTGETITLTCVDPTLNGTYTRNKRGT